MELTKYLLLLLATPLFAAPAPPVLGSAAVRPLDPAPPRSATVQSTPASGCCASSAYAVTFVESGDTTRVQIRDTAEGWTWESPPLDGHPVAHQHAGTPCQATVQDMDADQKPEVIVTLADGAPGGSVYVYKLTSKAFAPIPVEVGTGLGTRDFLVWDIPSPTAPVQITPFGHIEIRAHLFSLLGQTSGEGLFRWRVSRGQIRHLETIAQKP